MRFAKAKDHFTTQSQVSCRSLGATLIGTSGTQARGA